MIFLKLACPERFGTQGTAKPNCRTPGGASALVKILMYAIISRIALTSVGDGRTGRGGAVFSPEPGFSLRASSTLLHLL